MKHNVFNPASFVIAAACALTIAATANAAAAGDATANAASASTDAAQVARGAYLAKAADCAGCHTAAPRVSHPGAAPVATPAVCRRPRHGFTVWHDLYVEHHAGPAIRHRPLQL
ncbi:mono/diheme cytochrome c family protein [Paraburkholderia sp. WC7.3g]